MFQRRIGMKSASRFAWIVPAVVALALLLILLFGGDRNGFSPEIQRLEKTADHEILRVGRSAGYADLKEKNVPLVSRRRDLILQNLSVMRAEYKLVGPGIVVTSAAGNRPGQFLARTIGDLLAHYNLGQFRDKPSGTVPERAMDAPVTILARKKDAVIARALLDAVSPAFIGTITIEYTDTLRTGSLLMVVQGKPRFTAQGVAVFLP